MKRTIIGKYSIVNLRCIFFSRSLTLEYRRTFLSVFSHIQIINLDCSLQVDSSMMMMRNKKYFILCKVQERRRRRRKGISRKRRKVLTMGELIEQRNKGKNFKSNNTHTHTRTHTDRQLFNNNGKIYPKNQLEKRERERENSGFCVVILRFVFHQRQNHCTKEEDQEDKTEKEIDR